MTGYNKTKKMKYTQRQNLLSKIAEGVGHLDAAGSQIADGLPLEAITHLIAASSNIDSVLSCFPEATVEAVRTKISAADSENTKVLI